MSVCVSGDKWVMLLDKQLEVIPPPENRKWKDTGSAFFSRFSRILGVLWLLEDGGEDKNLTWLCLSSSLEEANSLAVSVHHCSIIFPWNYPKSWFFFLDHLYCLFESTVILMHHCADV